jgi:hypothetical protein
MSEESLTKSEESVNKSEETQEFIKPKFEFTEQRKINLQNARNKAKLLRDELKKNAPTKPKKISKLEQQLNDIKDNEKGQVEQDIKKNNEVKEEVKEVIEENTIHKSKKFYKIEKRGDLLYLLD